MLAYLFAQCSHAVGEFSLPAIAASLLSFLSFLSKFREISWGEVFSRKEERGDDDDETKYSSSPNELFFSAAKFFFVGRNFWREERTRQIFFFFSFSYRGGVSLEWKRKRERRRYSPILFSFAEDCILRQCFTLRNEFQDVERARKEGFFNDLDLERGLESSKHSWRRLLHLLHPQR